VGFDIAYHAVVDRILPKPWSLVVCRPETPLAAGIVYDLASAGIKSFGPSKSSLAAGGIQ